jgi:hypothetical protein
MVERIAALKNWYVHANREVFNAYQPPEAEARSLGGDVYGHENHKEGAHIITSSLKSNKAIKDGMYYSTQNTIYLLDGMCPKYEKWCKENGYL